MNRIRIFRHLVLLLLLSRAAAAPAAPESYPVRGRVIDRLTRQPVAYAAVVIAGQEATGASTDSLGRFTIERVKPGIYRLSASSLGYKSLLTPEYVVSAGTPFIEIKLEPDAQELEAVSITPSPFRRSVESPVSMHVIGVREIEKSPGSNRDISRIVRSYPGVSFSPVGYRNDLIVRGGGPAENRFYMDGIEIPNINHFATQGATGGPVSIVNADLIREISFYTGAFPADRSGALSSVLDFRLRDGDPVKQTFKATLGASEVSLSGSGHMSERTTYLFSVRQSYLQLLFKLLGLPFLPNFIDGQLKIKTRLSESDELIFLGLTGIDNMRLNTDEKGEEAEYLLSYLPRIRQETFTLGASWRHYAGRHVQTVTASHNYLNNRNTKYLRNDDSSEDRLTLRLRSVEQKTTLKAENRSYLGRWTLREGVELNYMQYTNATFQRLFREEAVLSDYRTGLGIVGWGLFAGADYTSADRRLTLSAGLRTDGCDYSPRMQQFWRRLSPRASASYALSDAWSVSASAGIYYQLPPYTALGFKDASGTLVNRGLDYQRVVETSAGFDWRLRDRLIVSVEGFCKFYDRMPLSVDHGIPLACEGNDYGTVGAEALVPTAEGRAYGVEALAKWQIAGKVDLVGSVTLFRSEYRPLHPLGMGQPLRGQPQRHLRPAPCVERRRQAERRGRRALHALRRRKVVARRGVGRSGPALPRLRALQQPAARRLFPARRAGGQNLLLPALHAGHLPRPAKRYGQQTPPAGRADVDGRRRQSLGPRLGAALRHENDPAAERHAAACAGPHRGILNRCPMNRRPAIPFRTSSRRPAGRSGPCDTPRRSARPAAAEPKSACRNDLPERPAGHPRLRRTDRSAPELRLPRRAAVRHPPRRRQVRRPNPHEAPKYVEFLSSVSRLDIARTSSALRSS